MSKKRHLILNHWDIKAIINNTMKYFLLAKSMPLYLQ